MSTRSARETLHEAVQTTASVDDDLEGSVLLGWVTVAEWSSPDGTRWLSRMESDARGEQPPSWQIQGYLHNALHAWPDEDES